MADSVSSWLSRLRDWHQVAVADEEPSLCDDEADRLLAPVHRVSEDSVEDRSVEEAEAVADRIRRIRQKDE